MALSLAGLTSHGVWYTLYLYDFIFQSHRQSLDRELILRYITISRGTRQGCPLSPLLFALSLEPLAQVIRLTHDPITIYNTKHHLSLYTDDVLIYVKNISTQLPDLLNTFVKFGDISGYKINWSKSALLPLNNVTSNQISP